MDIIFQSGDFYNQSHTWIDLTSIIASFLGALISGLIAIIIFRRGIKNEKKKEKEKSVKESDELEEFLFSNIYSLNFFINKQIDEIFKCSKKLKDWNNKDFLLPIFPELRTKDILKINQEKIFKTVVSDREGESEHKIEDFINLRNSFYNIGDFIKSQSELNNKTFQRYLFNIELWNNSLKELLELSNSFVLEYNIDTKKTSDDFLKFYTDLFVNKQREIIKNNDNDNMVLVFDNLIKPLKDYLKENKQSKDVRLLQISNPLINIQKAYVEISNLRNERRKQILYAGRRLLQIKQIMNQSTKNIKSRQKTYK